MSKHKVKRTAFTAAQRRLKKKHGTPEEFAAACYRAVPHWVSFDEARMAIEKYNAEWRAADQGGEAGK